MARWALFVASLAALLHWATGRTASAVVVGLFLAYAVTSAVLVHAQYADSLKKRDNGGHWWLFPFAVLTVIAAVCVLYSLQDAKHHALVAGIIFSYFAVGIGIGRIRYAADNRVPAWLGGLALALAAVTFALALVEISRNPSQRLGWLALAAAVFLIAPLGIACVSEAVIRRSVRVLGIELAVDESDGRLRRWFRRWFPIVLVGALGALLLIIPWRFAVNSAQPTVAIGALIALAALVIATASSTQAGIVIIFGVVAFLGITPFQASGGARYLRPSPGQHVLVALGDSYMSGEGASVYLKGTDQSFFGSHNPPANGCRRSPTAWAAQAGQTTPFDSMVFLACSGATTLNVRHLRDGLTPTPRIDGDGMTQLDNLDANYPWLTKPDLVVVSLGGNDAGFSTIGQMCLAPGSCNSQYGAWSAAMPQLGDLLRQAYAEIRARFPNSPILVVPYPRPIASAQSAITFDDLGTGCTQAPLDEGDLRFIDRYLNELNSTVHTVASEYGFYYLGEMVDALKRAQLQLCDNSNNHRPGINFIGIRSIDGIAEQRFNPLNWIHNSLHPNERGHQAMFRTFEGWLNQNPPTGLPRYDPTSKLGMSSAQAPPTAPATAPDVPGACSLTGKGGCTAQGKTWAQGQLAQATHSLRLLAAVLICGLGSWLLSVALFTWRRIRVGDPTDAIEQTRRGFATRSERPRARRRD